MSQEYVPKKIYCPRCGRYIMTYDGRGSIDIVKKCKKCNKLVAYEIAYRRVRLHPIPARQQSSGERFW